MPDKRILFTSDLHSGALDGLTHPRWHSKQFKFVQCPMWDFWETTVRKIGPVDVLVVNGDAVHGDGRRDETIGYLTTDMEEQAEIASECLKIVEYKKCRMTYGTPRHTVGTSNYERAVAKTLGAKIGEYATFDINGVKFDVRHVSGQSGTPYTQGTQISKEVVRAVHLAIEDGYAPPDFVVRAHVHNYREDRSGKRIGITQPCLQAPLSVYGRKYRGWYYDIGVVEVTVSSSGAIKITPHIMPMRLIHRRVYEKL